MYELYIYAVCSYVDNKLNKQKKLLQVATSILRRGDGNLTQEEKDSFFLLGEPRGEQNSHASASAMDRFVFQLFYLTKP